MSHPFGAIWVSSESYYLIFQIFSPSHLLLTFSEMPPDLCFVCVGEKLEASRLNLASSVAIPTASLVTTRRLSILIRRSNDASYRSKAVSFPRNAPSSNSQFHVYKNSEDAPTNRYFPLRRSTDSFRCIMWVSADYDKYKYSSLHFFSSLCYRHVPVRNYGRDWMLLHLRRWRIKPSRTRYSAHHSALDLTSMLFAYVSLPRSS